MERKRRFILFLAAAVLTTMLFIKGHDQSCRDRPVAFSSWSTSVVTIRVKGAVTVPGVYSFHPGAAVADVINLTMSAPAAGMPDEPLRKQCLRSGDIVEVTGVNPQRLAVRLKRMKAGEQILLGIPLHPDQMDGEDWDALPGIGPKLAKNLVADRQNNGDYRTIEAVQRVPGMGEKKFTMIRKYFDHD
ncbi:MAG TPA: helix-hairpin-helix domain-containing protein [Geobacteraceae bacterium]